MAKAIMVQGTASYCGKSLLVTALCKIFSEAGYRVSPFKAQNISLNSFVTREGGEVARAQALQAFAAGVEPRADMNPILIKPKGEGACQVVLHGRPYGDIKAKDYHSSFALKEGIKGVEESLSRLLSQYELVFIEGAGSPAEINLYEEDIANMHVAEMADAPVLLVGDIERGGVFASLLGTLALLKPKHRERVRGLIINKFSGERALLEPGLKELERMAKRPLIGVVPYIRGLSLPDEDSVSLESLEPQGEGCLDVAVIRLPLISNFSDFDPFELEPSVRLRYVKSLEEFGGPDVIILPGTKNTVQDLIWLKSSGLADRITWCAKRKVPLVGICGGYQMLGKRVLDKKGIEGGVKGEMEGLDLLDVITSFDEYRKVTDQVVAKVIGKDGMAGLAYGGEVRGYEIHMGKTFLGREARPAFRLVERAGKKVKRYDGAVSEDGLVLGTYIHGVFDSPSFRSALVRFLAMRKGLAQPKGKRESIQRCWLRDLEALAKVVSSSLDLDKVCEMMGLPSLESRLVRGQSSC